MNTQTITNKIINELQDYMFTSKNLDNYTKHIIKVELPLKESTKNINKYLEKYKKDNIKNKNNTTNNNQHIKNTASLQNSKPKPKPKPTQTKYYPKKKDSLFWCFYILKHGFSNYEMEKIGRAHV